MLNHAREAVDIARERHREDLDRDRLLNLALTRVLEIIGDAASQVTPATRQCYAAIEWGPIIGMRNRLIHGYDSVDFDILWNVIEKDLLALIGELERALKK
jgi:uncharacterized protein with HEPN domain